MSDRHGPRETHGLDAPWRWMRAHGRRVPMTSSSTDRRREQRLRGFDLGAARGGRRRDRRLPLGNASASPRATGDVDPAPPEVPTRFPIKHVVFLIKENRSFDNMSGSGSRGRRGHGRGATTAPARPLTRDRRRLHGTCPHCYNVLDRWRGTTARWTGSIRGPHGEWAYTQLRRDQLPNYWRLGAEYVAVRPLLRARPAGRRSRTTCTRSPRSRGERVDNPSAPASQSNTFGMRPPRQAGGRRAIDSEGNVVRSPPCFYFETEGDLLHQGGDPVGVLRGRQRSSVATSGPRTPRSDRYRETSGALCRNTSARSTTCSGTSLAGALPPVTWITPRFELSEHPETASATARTGPPRSWT